MRPPEKGRIVSPEEIAWPSRSICRRFCSLDRHTSMFLPGHCGMKTARTQPSCLCLNISYPRGASSREKRWVTRNEGSSLPCDAYSSRRGTYFCPCCCAVRTVSPLFMMAPIGNLSMTPYTPRMANVPPLRHARIQHYTVLLEDRAGGRVV